VQNVSKLQPSNLEIAFGNVSESSEVGTEMQTLDVTFSPNDGRQSRTITLRLGDPIHHDVGWSVLVEIVGFDQPYAQAIHGEDWAQAVELAAKILPLMLDLRTEEAGGGTLEPSFYERNPEPHDHDDERSC
jgi:hypothetical protein